MRILFAAFLVFFALFAFAAAEENGAMERGTPLVDIKSSFFNEGFSSGHLQGFASDGKYLYLAYSVKIFKTDLGGKLVKTGEEYEKLHLGDCCFAGGKLYVAVTDHSKKKEDASYVYVFDADLNLERKIHLPEIPFAAGGMEYWNGNFYIVSGREAKDAKLHHVYQYTSDFKFVKRYSLPVWNTSFGIETICFNNGNFYLGCYGDSRGDNGFTMRVGPDFENPQKIDFNTALGMIAMKNAPDGSERFLVAEGINIRFHSMTRWLKKAMFMPVRFSGGRFVVEDDKIADFRGLK